MWEIVVELLSYYLCLTPSLAIKQDFGGIFNKNSRLLIPNRSGETPKNPPGKKIDELRLNLPFDRIDGIFKVAIFILLSTENIFNAPLF